MIFVILGTQDKKFPRLLAEVEALILDGTIQEKVIVQAGTTKYKSKVMEIHANLRPKQFLDYVEQSDYIITHGGVGTILDALKKNKKVIAVPRLKEYKEHENDHQLQIIQKFNQEHYIIGCNQVSDLKKAIRKIHTFQPRPYQLNNEQMVSMVSNYIDTTSTKRKDFMIFLFYAICALLLQIGINQVPIASNNMWLSWLISYIVLIGFTYQKKSYSFEIVWGVFLAFAQWFWFIYFEQTCAMIMITLVADMITYIGHKMFYTGRLK